MDVLFEDNHLLIVNKPAGLPTMGVAASRPSLICQAKQYIKGKYKKPGKVYLGIVSRLDAPVTGVLLMARTSKAASRLTRQFREGEVEKSYWALVWPAPERAGGRCVDWVRKDERHRRMHISEEGEPQAKQARLQYQLLQRLGADRALLEVQLETGRKHQIRVQLAARGWHILGDRKYGSTVKFPRGIALHARRLALTHPVRKTPLCVEAPLPPAWGNLDL